MKQDYKIIKNIIIMTLLINAIILPANAQTIQQTKTQTPPEVIPERLRVNLTETIPQDLIHVNSP